MAHTPGPWSWTQWPGISGHTHFGIDADKWRLAIVHSGNADDANLMAAAPDLLAACHRLLEYWRHGTAVDGGSESADAVMSAVAKAEGRE